MNVMANTQCCIASPKQHGASAVQMDSSASSSTLAAGMCICSPYWCCNVFMTIMTSLWRLRPSLCSSLLPFACWSLTLQRGMLLRNRSGTSTAVMAGCYFQYCIPPISARGVQSLGPHVPAIRTRPGFEHQGFDSLPFEGPF